MHGYQFLARTVAQGWLTIMGADEECRGICRIWCRGRAPSERRGLFSCNVVCWHVEASTTRTKSGPSARKCSSSMSQSGLSDAPNTARMQVVSISRIKGPLRTRERRLGGTERRLGNEGLATQRQKGPLRTWRCQSRVAHQKRQQSSSTAIASPRPFNWWIRWVGGVPEVAQRLKRRKKDVIVCV